MRSGPVALLARSFVLRAVVDTNVLIAAAITPRGLCGRLLDAAIAERWWPVVSPMLLAELDGVLGREKFRRWLTLEEAARFVAGIRVLSDVVDDPPASAVTSTADPDDEFLVALARVAGVDALVSGDPHLTALVDLHPPVLTPAAFWEQLQS